MIRNIKWLLFALLLSAPLGAEAQVINAASCSSTDVQAAFKSVVASTTTVNIPACPAGVGWSTHAALTIPSGNTSLSILGAGTLATTGGGDQTVIIDNYAGSGALISVTSNSSPSSFVRIAGITIKGGNTGTGNDKYDGVISINGPSQNVRFDHNHINLITYSPYTQGSGVEYQGCLAGVTDHNIIEAAAGNVNNLVRLYNSGTCNSDSLGVGDQSWAQPTNFGSSNFMFVESNILNGSAGNDCTKGGRYVWRFNTMNITTPSPTTQTHPTGGAGRFRGCRAMEIYKNQATAVANNYVNTFFWMSSGTALVWGNTLPSSSAGGGTGYRSVIAAHNMRSDNSTYGQTATPNGWGYCGASFNGAGSNWDGNTSSSTGYPCLDQVGRGKGDLLIGGFTSDGSGSNNVTNAATGCSGSQSCAWPRQALEPVYEWADAYSPVPNNPSSIWSQNGPGDIQNQDYYLGTSNSGSPIAFNGTVGVGAGALSARPSNCTTGVAYWATDQGNWNQSGSGGQGVLYQCSSANTWTLYYTPFTYPHPLAQGSTSQATAPDPPSNLAATVQ
jgi:hypothetical protein